jgi:hypothetical protein
VALVPLPQLDESELIDGFVRALNEIRAAV